MTKYLAIAILITSFLVGDAYGEPRIYDRNADVYFDDGSVLHNAKYSWPGDYGLDQVADTVRFKYENEIFTLKFSDIKSIEFVADAGVVTLKIKTKTGVVVNDQFLLNIKNTDLRGGWYCEERRFSFVSKLTGKRITKRYSITNLTQKVDQFRERRYRRYCVFKEHGTKAISSIVFKDG